MPSIHPQGKNVQIAQLDNHQFITRDGVVLPFKSWLSPPHTCKAVIVALHGLNDYSNFFNIPGEYLKQRGISSYAYDQRGFGASANTGTWAGTDTYVQDALLFTRLIKHQHPELPIYILGESMGGAIAAVALSQKLRPDVNGIILAAPAVWSRTNMPWYQRSLLWSLAHTLPWLTLTGEGVKVTPSDNIEMLRDLGRDPLVIKATRVETVYGMANLMDKAYASAAKLNVRQLLLYGEKDDIIPAQPIYQFLNNLTGDQQTSALYPNSYHMLLRDLQGEIILNDINAWIDNKESSLPSGADNYGKETLGALLSENAENYQ
jgi:alpha-beta hydrolase superfamily lysophospholipase